MFNLFLGLRRHGLFQKSRGGELRTIIQTVITVVCRPCNDLLALLGTIERPSGPLLECWRKKGICTSSPRVSTLAVVLIVILLMKFGDRERSLLSSIEPKFCISQFATAACALSNFLRWPLEKGINYMEALVAVIHRKWRILIFSAG